MHETGTGGVSRPEAEAPIVSVIIPTFNAQRYVAAAVRSALAQSLQQIEVVLVDDCSTDDTMAILGDLEAADPRVRVHRLARNGGPGAARNHAIAAARGRFAAILDSDDLMAADRLARLVAIAEREGADIVADNLVLFDSDDRTGAGFFLDGATRPGWITAEHYLAETVIYKSGADFGYLKPLFRLEPLRASGIGYNERLRIAEDDNLVVRLLLAGLRYWLEPSAGYAYRRHAGSISHRLTVATAEAMAAANAAILATADRDLPMGVHRALLRRQQALATAVAFEHLRAALNARRIGEALGVAIASPSCLPLLRMPIAARLAERLGRPVEAQPKDPAAIAALDQIIGPAS